MVSQNFPSLLYYNYTVLKRDYITRSGIECQVQKAMFPLKTLVHNSGYITCKKLYEIQDFSYVIGVDCLLRYLYCALSFGRLAQ